MNYCIDCKKELNTEAKYSKTIRCKSCENKRRHRLGIFKIKYNIDNPNYKDGLPHCIDCGTKLKDYKSKRCSGCWYKFNTGKNHSRFGGGIESRKRFCIDCDKLLNISAFYNNNKRCQECYLKINIGINNSNWRGGISKLPYPIEFNDELKELIRKRDNHICQNCSMTDEEHLIVCGYNLTIHHIDYNKFNCSKDNLITLCQSCNSRANHNRIYWQELYQNKIAQLKIGGIQK
jgi:hypothetical protein